VWIITVTGFGLAATGSGRRKPVKNAEFKGDGRGHF
jgi:hypothetical protein